MTTLTYRVGNTTTKSYATALKLAEETGCVIKKIFHEHLEIDDLDKICELDEEDNIVAELRVER